MVDLANSPREHPITTISLALLRALAGEALSPPPAIARAVQRNANTRRRGPKSRRGKAPMRPCPSDLIWGFIDEATRDLLEHVTLDDLARAPAGEGGKTLASKELTDQARYKDGLPWWA